MVVQIHLLSAKNQVRDLVEEEEAAVEEAVKTKMKMTLRMRTRLKEDLKKTHPNMKWNIVIRAIVMANVVLTSLLPYFVSLFFETQFVYCNITLVYYVLLTDRWVLIYVPSTRNSVFGFWRCYGIRNGFKESWKMLFKLWKKDKWWKNAFFKLPLSCTL